MFLCLGLWPLHFKGNTEKTIPLPLGLRKKRKTGVLGDIKETKKTTKQGINLSEEHLEKDALGMNGRKKKVMSSVGR